MRRLFTCVKALPRNAPLLLRLAGSSLLLEGGRHVVGFSHAYTRAGVFVMARRCFALDLKSDPELIAEYERHHEPGAAWPVVIEHIRASGVEAMEIWRTGDRMIMIAEVADDYPREVEVPIENDRWEELMWRFQRPLPHATEGEKWLPMTRIFSLDEQ